MKKLNQRTAEISLFMTTAIWGSTFLIIKLMVASDVSIKPFTLLFYRFLIATIATLIILRPQKKTSLQELKGGLIIGLAAFIGYAFQTLGLQHTSPARSGFITSTFVIFVPFVSYFWEKQALNRKILFSLLPATLGLYLISGIGSGNSKWNIGDQLTVISAIAYAFQVVGIQVFTKKFNFRILILVQFAFITFASLPFMLFEKPDIVFSSALWIGLIYLGLIASVVALGVQMYAQRYTTSNRASMVYISEPIFAASFAWFVGGQSMSSIEIVGAFLIIFAIIFTLEKKGKY